MVGVAAAVSVRRRDGAVVEDLAWAQAPVALLEAAAPWRTFRWFQGQGHYPGAYWSATMRDHVVYESRLELARVLFADFDASVLQIIAQPFLLTSVVEGRACNHVPDYLLVTKQGPVIVDVKPRHRLARPQVASQFAWTREVVESRGWRFEVWSEPPQRVLENVRFLAGYRRDWLFRSELLEELRGTRLDGAAVGQAVGCLPRWPQPLVRAGLFHLMWTGELLVDLKVPLGSRTVIRSAA